MGQSEISFLVENFYEKFHEKTVFYDYGTQIEGTY